MTSMPGEDPVMTNVLGRTSVGFERGFNDQQTELAIDSLEVKTLNHGFDGLAMLHKFDIVDGRVSHANRFLDPPARRADADGKMAYSEFATDPCRSLFKRFTQVFTGPAFGANANVTIGAIAARTVAQTEYPMPVAFDPQTLDTIGVVSFDDRLKGAVTTAHPHHDPDERAAD